MSARWQARSLFGVVAPEGPLLRRNGEPVWPCADRGAFNSLRRSLETFGVRLEELSSSEVTSAKAAPDASDTVVALGEANFEQAQLYAHLTGRAARVISRVTDLRDVACPAALVATWPQLGVADLSVLYDESVSRAPIGLIVGLGRHDLHHRALICAGVAFASRHFADLPELPTHAVIGSGNAEEAAADFDRVTSRSSGPAELSEVLRGPASILGFVGHSDGVDASLSSRATLCARVEPDPIELDRRPANCDLTGYCHRRHLAKADALATRELISPRQIEARVMLMLSCYIARPSDCSVHPQQGLLAQMLQSARVGAVVTPWEVAYPSVAELTSLARLQREGRTIGSALAAFFRVAEGVQRGCNRYLLLGDPETCAIGACRPFYATAPASGASQASTRVVPTAAATATATAKGTATRLPLIELHAVAGAAVTTTLRRRTPGWDALGWFGARVERLARNRKCNSRGERCVPDDMLARARAAASAIEAAQDRRPLYKDLLRAILSFEGSSFVHWMEDARSIPEFVKRDTECFGCGLPGRLFRVETYYSTRWMACCTQCDSFYADTPADSPLLDVSFSVRPGGEIEHTLGALPNGVIAMNLRSSLEIRTTWFLGEPFDLKALPPGRSWLWLHALCDDGLYSYSRMIDNRPLPSQQEAHHDRKHGTPPPAV